RPPQELQGPLVLGLWRDPRIQARHGFQVMVENVGARRHRDLQGVPVALVVGDQHFYGRSRAPLADRADGAVENLRAAVDEVVTGDRRDHRMLEPQDFHRGRDPFGLRPVQLRGPARLDGAETACARADVAQDHEGGGAVLPALEDVGALGLFADGMQGQAPHQVLEPPVVGAQGSPHLEPWGLPRRVVVFRALRRPLAQDRLQDRLLGHGVQGQKRQLAFHAHHSYRCLRPAQRRAAGGRRQYRAVSGPKPSRRRLTLCRNRPTYRPSVTRWSKDRHTFIIERMPMASPTTTGRRTMASIVMMAAWGGLMIGYDATEPKAPVLLTVMVAPCTSSRVSLPARARPTRSAKVRAIPAMLRRSASRMTGTTSPSSSPTATPMWIRFFTTIRSSCQLALRRGNSFRLSTTALMKKGTYVRSTPS